MAKDDILKKAIELYEKDNNRSEEYEKQSLTELDIPQEYYDKAKKEIQSKKKKWSKVLMQFAPMILIFGGGLIYFLVKNVFITLPVATDHSCKFRYSYLDCQVNIVSETKDRFEFKSELYSPDGKRYDIQRKVLSFNWKARQNLRIRTRFNKSPKAGEWKLKITTKLAKFGFSSKIIFDKTIDFKAAKPKKIIVKYPEVRDFVSRQYRSSLSFRFRLMSDGKDSFELTAELFAPDGKRYDIDRKRLSFRYRASQNLSFTTRFNQAPQVGHWKFVVKVKPLKGSFNRKTLLKKEVEVMP